MKVLLLIGCCLVAATQAQAADDTAILRESVFVGDLRTDTQAGLDTVYQRVEAAAKRVCGPLESSNRLGTEFRKCTREAVEKATAQIPAFAHYDHKKHKIRNG